MVPSLYYTLFFLSISFFLNNKKKKLFHKEIVVSHAILDTLLDVFAGQLLGQFRVLEEFGMRTLFK